MAVHGEIVELREGREGAEEEHDHAAALNRLDGASQEVRGQCLKVLQCGRGNGG